MLNAIEPSSPLPIHRHQKTSETVVSLRGRLAEEFDDDLEILYRVHRALPLWTYGSLQYTCRPVAYGACAGIGEVHCGDEEWEV